MAPGTICRGDHLLVKVNQEGAKTLYRILWGRAGNRCGAVSEVVIWSPRLFCTSWGKQQKEQDDQKAASSIRRGKSLPFSMASLPKQLYTASLYCFAARPAPLIPPMYQPVSRLRVKMAAAG